MRFGRVYVEVLLEEGRIEARLWLGAAFGGDAVVESEPGALILSHCNVSFAFELTRTAA